MNELTTTEAAELYGYKPDTIRKYISTGKIKARKLRRDWLVDSDSIDAYLKEKRVYVRGETATPLDGFKAGWADMLEGRTHPIDELWDGIE
jgi:excisionase family DNA binding protein